MAYSKKFCKLFNAICLYLLLIGCMLRMPCLQGVGKGTGDGSPLLGSKLCYSTSNACPNICIPNKNYKI